MANALEIKNISFRYNEKYIFNNFNLTIKKNDFVYLIGTNNSGKSTLIKILNGCPFNGEFYVDNMEFNKKNQENICQKLKIIDVKYLKQCKLIDLIDNIKMLSNDNYEKYIKDYNLLQISSNNYQKLSLLDKIKASIFINLIGNSDFLIIDEIIDMLNSKDKYVLYKLIKKYQRSSKKTIFIISNNTDGIIYAKRILLLDKGVILFDGTIKDIEKHESIFNELSIKLPFEIDLSLKLKLYDLIENIYTDEKRMIRDIWKK